MAMRMQQAGYDYIKNFCRGELTGVEGSDAGAIIRYSDGAAGPLRNRTQRQVRRLDPLLGWMEGQEQVQREQRGEIETGPLRRRIDDFAG